MLNKPETSPPSPPPTSSSSSNTTTARQRWVQLKEQIRDLEVKKLLQESLCDKPKRAIQEGVYGLKEGVQDEIRELKADLHVQQQLLQLDVQDWMSSAYDWPSRFMTMRRGGVPTDNENDDELSPSPNNNNNNNTTPNANANEEAPNTTVEVLKQELRDYERKLNNSAAFVSELNACIANELSSSQEMMEYYQARPGLKTTLTLETDLPRMKYTVYTHTGQKLTTPDDIFAYATTTTTTPTEEGPSDDVEILWRAANQSIFGDVITCLTTATALVRPQWGASTSVDDVTIVLDLARNQPHLTAECYINLIIPMENNHNGDGNNNSEQEEDQDNKKSDQLFLAGIVVGVYFCPVLEKMEARIIHICPGPPLSEAQVTAVAEGLASV